ncbi:hypothetical protein D1BOALGB6SA_4996 [Olavius sp. associated proteobacterium Delta 1]|nr:hypothetical protein D1BOALGB6SA_4996 [Olavius sp. associated proteobacterium Delta 1]
MSLIHWSEATSITENNINWFNKKYLKMHLKLPKAFLFPGKLAMEYHHNCGFSLINNVFYASNSIDGIFSITENEFEEKFSNIKPLKFLFVGSFVKEKGFDLLNAVFVRLTENKYNFELHVAGDGLIKPTDGIFNHGFLSKIEALRLYKKCHVFLMPSIADCNPLSLIEAAKTGNAILASRGVGNYPEFVNGNGYVFEIGNENELFIACTKILAASKDKLAKMANKSIELTSEISHAHSAQSFYNAIRHAIN